MEIIIGVAIFFAVLTVVLLVVTDREYWFPILAGALAVALFLSMQAIVTFEGKEPPENQKQSCCCCCEGDELWDQ